jgi:2-keto-4-pentenoate hydratase/2-oxohepta-3-ene-1,7-dioic acid hydratase in catechol pathway
MGGDPDRETPFFFAKPADAVLTSGAEMPYHTIAFLSGLLRLAPGDLVFTGTPAGVAAVVRGDVLAGRIEGVGTVATRIV